MPNQILLTELGHEIAENLRKLGPTQGRKVSADEMKAYVDCYWWQFERAGAQPPNIQATIDHVARNL